jgi:hypothetical protein
VVLERFSPSCSETCEIARHGLNTPEKETPVNFTGKCLILGLS